MEASSLQRQLVEGRRSPQGEDDGTDHHRAHCAEASADTTADHPAEEQLFPDRGDDRDGGQHGDRKQGAVPLLWWSPAGSATTG